MDSKKYAFDLLNNDATLATILGGTGRVLYMYPNEFTTLPVVTYSEVGNRSADFFDDTTYSELSIIQVDIWANTSTTAIAKRIDALFYGAQYAKDYSADVPEPDSKIQHRVLRYSRSFTADDLD